MAPKSARLPVGWPARRDERPFTVQSRTAVRCRESPATVLAGVRPGEIKRTRRRKPQIPATGHAGIPIRDELILERDL